MCRSATINDIPALTELFWSNISKNPDYISHGEIQMGVADNSRTLAPDGRKKWENYIRDKITAASGRVLIAESENRIAGFIILEKDSDNDAPFGIICDIVVVPDIRGTGIGTRLLEEGMQWLKKQGISDFYLESGVRNLSAHKFFERHGFKLISHVFRFEPDAE